MISPNSIFVNRKRHCSSVDNLEHSAWLYARAFKCIVMFDVNNPCDMLLSPNPSGAKLQVLLLQSSAVLLKSHFYSGEWHLKRIFCGLTAAPVRLMQPFWLHLCFRSLKVLLKLLLGVMLHENSR